MKRSALCVRIVLLGISALLFVAAAVLSVVSTGVFSRCRLKNAAADSDPIYLTIGSSAVSTRLEVLSQRYLYQTEQQLGSSFDVEFYSRVISDAQERMYSAGSRISGSGACEAADMFALLDETGSDPALIDALDFLTQIDSGDTEYGDVSVFLLPEDIPMADPLDFLLRVSPESLVGLPVLSPASDTVLYHAGLLSMVLSLALMFCGERGVLLFASCCGFCLHLTGCFVRFVSSCPVRPSCHPCSCSKLPLLSRLRQERRAVLLLI